MSEQARGAFAKEFACPDARVIVVEQHGRAFSPGPPPDELARDPARLAVWRRQVAELSAKMADRTYYVARGCGREQTLDCVGEEKADNNLYVTCYDTSPGQPDPDLSGPAAGVP